MGIKRVGQDPFKSTLANSDAKQRSYLQGRARNPELFRGDVREKHYERSMRSRQIFQERIEIMRQRRAEG